MMRTLARVAAALLVAAGAQAQQANAANPADTTRDPMHAPGRELTVRLLTMGNGEDIYALFGHSAIWVHDNVTMRDTVFNWGAFDLRQPNFILHFLQGLNLYTIEGQRIDDLLLSYRYWNRSVTAQELDLSANQKDTLVAIINENMLPENRRYRYDYFVENCATRPRDILDRVLGGQLRVGADSVTPTSYRWHALRLMQDNKPLALGVNIGLGEPSDEPATAWQEMFLPRKLHDWVATRQVKDSAGGLHPLVKGERVLFKSTRPPEHEAPPSFAWLWIAGVIIGGLLAWLGVRALTGGRGARVGAAIAFGLWAFIAGMLGSILTLLWTVTDHRFAYANENLLLFNPLWLVLAVLLPMFFLRGRAPVLTRGLVIAVFGLAVVALAAHAGLSKQDNLGVIGLALPVAAAALFVALRARNVQMRPS
jgi:hypothetical protein